MATRDEARGDELVVLVDEQDQELGTALKQNIHTADTPLHRAFSVFLFNKNGEVLVTQRAFDKVTWPGVWSNSCCGHPAPGEGYEEAIHRRVREELGCEIEGLKKVSHYQYRFERGGIVEHEICPVFKGLIDAKDLQPNLQEVHDWKWMNWDEWMQELDADQPGVAGKWSEWCKEEVKLFR